MVMIEAQHGAAAERRSRGRSRPSARDVGREMSLRGKATSWASVAAGLALLVAARSTSGWVSIAAWVGCYAFLLATFVAGIIFTGRAEEEDIRCEHKNGHEARDQHQK